MYSRFDVDVDVDRYHGTSCTCKITNGVYYQIQEKTEVREAEVLEL
jgi:hypothetical protein